MLKGGIFYQQYYIYLMASAVYVFVFFKNEFEAFCFVVTFCYIAVDKSFKPIAYDCLDCNNRGYFPCVYCWGMVEIISRKT